MSNNRELEEVVLFLSMEVRALKARLEEIGPALVLPSPLLANLAFLTPDGRHSAAVVNSFATQNVELGDRAYFRVHLDKPSNGFGAAGRVVLFARPPVDCFPQFF